MLAKDNPIYYRHLQYNNYYEIYYYAADDKCFLEVN